MALTLTRSLIFSVLVSLLSLGQIVQAATFRFSTGSLTISEGGNLSQVLFINKTGDNVDTITFQVTVMGGTANPNTDYMPNSDHDYTFTSDTRSLPIRTQLITDRAGEGIEHFMICLPTQSQFNSDGQGAMVGSPSCVTITIIDDDSVVIGFQDDSTSVSITEGGPSRMICAEVKSFGLELDPFDSVPLDLRADSGSRLVLGASTFTFTAANTVRCTTVSIDDNNLVDGTRTSQVMLAERSPPTTTVPTELYPGSSQVIINDDESDVIGFRFAAQSSYTIMEGDRLSDIKIMKYGNATSLNFLVVPTVDPTNLEDISVMGAQFAPSVSEENIVLEALNNLDIAEPRQFHLSIDKSNIRADNGVNNVSGFYVSIGGDPIQITLYDNDFEVGFTRDTVPISREVCIKIFNPRDVHPNTHISLSIMVRNSMSPTGVALEMSDVTLNATNTTVCTYVKFDDDTCRDATLELYRTNDNANSIRFLLNTTTITCSVADDAPIIAGVTVPIIVIALVFIPVIILVVLWRIRHKKSKYAAKDSQQEHQSDMPPNKSGTSDANIAKAAAANTAGQSINDSSSQSGSSSDPSRHANTNDSPYPPSTLPSQNGNSVANVLGSTLVSHGFETSSTLNGSTAHDSPPNMNENGSPSGDAHGSPPNMSQKSTNPPSTSPNGTLSTSAHGSPSSTSQNGNHSANADSSMSSGSPLSTSQTGNHSSYTTKSMSAASPPESGPDTGMGTANTQRSTTITSQDNHSGSLDD